MRAPAARAGRRGARRQPDLGTAGRGAFIEPTDATIRSSAACRPDRGALAEAAIRRAGFIEEERQHEASSTRPVRPGRRTRDAAGRYGRALQAEGADVLDPDERPRRPAEDRAVRRQPRRRQCRHSDRRRHRGHRRLQAAPEDPGDHLPLRPLPRRALGELAPRAAGGSDRRREVHRAGPLFGLGRDSEPAADPGPGRRPVPALPGRRPARVVPARDPDGSVGGRHLHPEHQLREVHAASSSSSWPTTCTTGMAATRIISAPT